MSELLGVKLLLGVAGVGWGARALVLLWAQVQVDRDLCLSLGWGLCFPGSCVGPSYTWCWERCYVLNCDLECVRTPVFLGGSDLLLV